MNFKSILTFTSSLLLALTLLVSCSDDDNGSSDANPPSLTAPESSANPNLIIGDSADLTFNVNVPGGYASSSVEATNGTASITSEPSVGSTSGTVVVNFSANSSGAATITLTVTDEDGLSDDATTAVSITEEASEVLVSANITSDTTWETGKTYILGGRIAVEAGATLTIQGGVIVKGEAGTGANSTALLVARDATLNANGTADAPIIFTSVADEITPDDVASGNFGSPNLDPDIQGLWGGVIVLGNAPISASTSPTQIEGIPTSDTNGLYGGDDPEDSSGSITYISIRHGGSNIGEGNEINGLTLGGVGTGTVVENVEIVANQDDGVEWFGGTVNVTNVLVWNNGDDGLDTDQAWAGSVTNSVLVNPEGSLFELDGPEGSYTSTGHTISNVTAYSGPDTGAFLIDTDDNTDVFVDNVLFLWAEGSSTILDDNYEEYADNTEGYEITNIEAILPSGSALTDLFPQALIDSAPVTSVNSIGEATVGADVSVFGWTWASQSGALAELGLE
ncbi:MAG: hypothetical protein RI573_17980 [Balneolaceae bacterium]|nr:hypothetical protein [Balneolaceae bacterium]